MRQTVAKLTAERDEQKAALAAALGREAALADAQVAQSSLLASRKAEFRERVEHQRAIADVLKAMSALPGDPQPVFDLIVRRAAELCGAPRARLARYDGHLKFRGPVMSPIEKRSISQ